MNRKSQVSGHASRSENPTAAQIGQADLIGVAHDHKPFASSENFFLLIPQTYPQIPGSSR